MNTFPLWAFSDDAGSERILITRGRTMEEAMEHASNSPYFRVGVTIFSIDYLPIHAAESYSKNHAPGWLSRAPYWLYKKEMQELEQRVRREGFQPVRDSLVQEVLSALKERQYE